MIEITANNSSKLITRCLNSQQYSLDTLYKLCKLTDELRKICKTKKGADKIASLLKNKRAMLYFNQPSTRTFLSFQNACYILGIKCSDIRDTSTSSEVKGETELDTVKTFSQYVNLIIMRHPTTDFIKEVSSSLSTNKLIINAGSGTDQHPTQALLDFYTIYKYGFKNKNIVFVGDLKRSRTVRSLALLLNKIEGLNFYFVAPEAYQIKSDILEELTVEYILTTDFAKVLPIADVVYMTRLQDEYGGISEKFDRAQYSINEANINKLKKTAIIMHPLPRREEISLAIDEDNRAKYFEQVENGMWVRAALILMMFGMEESLHE